MRKIKISVLMSEYNTPEKDFITSVKSILNQTFQDFEFIIIDDSGKSRVSKLIKPYHDKRIHIIDNKSNRGLVYSLNKGLNESKGVYIARMDTDDIAKPDRLYKQLRFIEKHSKYSVVGTRALEFYDNKELGILGKSGEKTINNLSLGDTLIHPSVIMKREDIIANGGYDDFHRAEDLALWLKLLLAGKKLYMMDDVLLKYRVNPSDYGKRSLSNRKGEIAARIYYYPKLRVKFSSYIIIIKSLIAGIVPNKLVRLYHNKFVLTKIEAYENLKGHKPSVTIIVPVYNLEKYIGDTLDSILAQTFINFQLIVINDGSIDGTQEKLEQYSKIYNNLIIINNNNGGVSSARNTGICKIDTDYFTFVDGDDIIHPQYLSSLVDTIESTNTDVAISYIARQQKKMRISNKKVQILTADEACKQLLYGKAINNSPCGKIYRSSSLKNIRFNEDISIGEDMEYVFNCLLKSKTIAITHHMLYTYIHRRSSAMNQVYSYKRTDSYRVAKKIYKYASTTQLGPAATAKLFIEALTIAALSHNKKKKNHIIFEECVGTMSLTAKAVTMDSNVLPRHRIYAILTLIKPILPIRLFLFKSYIIRK